MPEALRPILAGLLAPWITYALARLATWAGAEFAPEVIDAQTRAIVDLVALLFAVLASTNRVPKQVIEAKVNPGNAASPLLAQVEKVAVETARDVAPGQAYAMPVAGGSITVERPSAATLRELGEKPRPEPEAGP